MVLVVQAAPQSFRLTSNYPDGISKLVCPVENLNIPHSSQTHFFPHSPISEHGLTIAEAKKFKFILDSFLSLKPLARSVAPKHGPHQPISAHPQPSSLLLPCPGLPASVRDLAACTAHGIWGSLLCSDTSVESCGSKNKVHTPAMVPRAHLVPLPTPTAF